MSPVSMLCAETRAPQILWDMFGMGKLSTQSSQENIICKHRRCLISRYIKPGSRGAHSGCWGRLPLTRSSDCSHSPPTKPTAKGTGWKLRLAVKRG